MQNAIKDSYRPKNRNTQEIEGNVTVLNPTPPIIIGADTDGAVEGDAAGSLSAKIRGLNKTITDLNTNIENLIDNYQLPISTLLRGMLVEMKVMNYYLREGLNVKDQPEVLVKDYAKEIDRQIS